LDEQHLFLAAHLGSALLLCALSYALGRQLCQGVDFDSAAEELAVSTTLGLGLHGLLALLLGLLGLLNAPAVLAALLLVQVACRRVWHTAAGRVAAALRTRRGRWAALAVAAALPALGWLAQPALYPPVAWDATMYHLACAKVYVQEGAVVLTPYLRFPTFPQLTEMLFALMLLLHDEVAAQMVSFVSLMLSALLLYAWGRRTYSVRTGLWAAALWLSSPEVLWLGWHAYIDATLVLFVTASLYCFWVWRATGSRCWLGLAAACTGLATGAKYTGLFFGAVLTLVLLGLALKRRRGDELLCFCATAGAVALPWYARNAWLSGDPLFPFGGPTFGFTLWRPEDLAGLVTETRSPGAGTDLGALLRLPWNLTFNDEVFRKAGRLTPLLYYALPVTILGSMLDPRSRTKLALLLGFTLFWFASFQQLRYLQPVIPILCLLSAAVFDRLAAAPRPLRRPAPAALAACAGLALILYGYGLAAEGRVVFPRDPLPLTPRERDGFLAQHLPTYPAYRLLNQRHGRDYVLYAYRDERMAYFADGQFLGDWFGPAAFDRLGPYLSEGAHAEAPEVIPTVFDPAEPRVVSRGEGLHRELRSLGAGFFLFPGNVHDGRLPEDEFFHSRFRLIHAAPAVQLYKLTQRPLQRETGPELLGNSGFERRSGLWPDAWYRVGTPLADASGRQSFSGSTAILSPDDRNVALQSVAVQPGALYRLRQHVRAASGTPLARLQIVWFDAQDQLLTFSIQLVQTGSGWQRAEMLVSAPERAVRAEVLTSPHGQGGVWFDEMSFAEVIYRERS
jgi:4-amino-4-deoxy-L-arabinose transferase-like glycosyltransferase